jgi:hypothetical protein
MMWIDIGVTVLLILRLALLRPPLPQPMDPNNDAWLLEEKNEQHLGPLLLENPWKQ